MAKGMPGNRNWCPGTWDVKKAFLEERAGDFTPPKNSSPLRRRKSWLPGRGDEDMPWHRVHISRGFAVLVMIHCAIRCRWIKTEQIENNSRGSLSSAQCHRGEKRVVVLSCQLLGDLEAPEPVCESTSKSRLKEVGIVTLITGSIILRAKATDWMREKPRGAPEFVSLCFLPEATAWPAASNSCRHCWEVYLHNPQGQKLWPQIISQSRSLFSYDAVVMAMRQYLTKIEMLCSIEKTKVILKWSW